jgi:hypothetical protein
VPSLRLVDADVMQDGCRLERGELIASDAFAERDEPRVGEHLQGVVDPADVGRVIRDHPRDEFVGHGFAYA